MTLALPKPLKSDRKRGEMDTSDLVLAKRHFPRSGDYKAWVRSQRCLLHWFSRCDGDVEAAHMQRGGASIKGSDFSCVPLCGRNHHRLLDGNSLDWEVMCFLWKAAWELLHAWHRKGQ